MKDEAGPDAKVLCVPAHDARWVNFNELDDVPDHLLQEIHHFFEVYKALEPHKEADVRGWDARPAAEAAIEEARAAYGSTHSG
jgi:inorganic pyrophosphatase